MASIRLSGADRLTWLQGQVTNDVFASSRFCLCAPNGQIEGVFSMRADAESHVLESTVSGCEALLRRVVDYVILEDVVAEGLPPGEEGDPRLAGGRVYPGSPPSPSDPPGAIFPSEEGKALVSRRDAESAELGNASPSPGSQEKVPRLAGGDEVDSGKQAYSLSPLGGEGTLSFDSLAAGEIDPRFDIPPGTVPADLGERFFAAHVSLTKGCYTGQEVIHRMHARGAGKKTWAVLELSEAPKDPSAFTRWATDGTRILAGAFLTKENARIGEEVSIGGTSARIVMLG